MTDNTVSDLQHRTVLLEEAVDALAIEGARADGIFIDGTFGRGGHSRRILERLGPRGRLIAFDKDPQAVAAAHALVQSDSRFEVVHDSFATMAAALVAAKSPARSAFWMRRAAIRSTSGCVSTWRFAVSSEKPW